MFDKVRLSCIVVSRILGPYSLYCILILLILIFKTYKDLNYFHVFLSYVSTIWKMNLLNESCLKKFQEIFFRCWLLDNLIWIFLKDTKYYYYYIYIYITYIILLYTFTTRKQQNNYQKDAWVMGPDKKHGSNSLYNATTHVTWIRKLKNKK